METAVERWEAILNARAQRKLDAAYARLGAAIFLGWPWARRFSHTTKDAVAHFTELQSVVTTQMSMPEPVRGDLPWRCTPPPGMSLPLTERCDVGLPTSRCYRTASHEYHADAINVAGSALRTLRQISLFVAMCSIQFSQLHPSWRNSIMLHAKMSYFYMRDDRH